MTEDQLQQATVEITVPCVCVSVTRRRFGIERKIPSKLVDTTADKSMVGARKKLLTADSFKKVRQIDGTIRARLNDTCLPSPFSGGVYLLPVAMLKDLDGQLEVHATSRAAAVDTFIAEYPDIKQQARTKLGDLFDEDQYPSSDEVRQAFHFDWTYVNFGTPDELHDVDEAVYRSALHKNQRAMEETALLARQTMRAAALMLVEKMVDRLEPDADGEPKVFRDSLVSNMVEWLGTFEMRDITDDAELQASVTKMRNMLNGVDPAVLRDDDVARTATLKAAITIAAKLDTLVVEGAAIRDFSDD